MDKRSYRQYCGIARALDVIGERWTLLIARNLLTGPKRYADLMAGNPGITTNLLAERLKAMTHAGLIERRSEEHGLKMYALTPMGLALEPVLMELGRFGFRYFMESPRESDTLDIGWSLISTKRRFTNQAEATVELDFGTRKFQVRAKDGHVEVREGTAFEPEARIATDMPTFRSLAYAGASARKLEKAGKLSVTGSRDAFARYLRAFDFRA